MSQKRYGILLKTSLKLETSRETKKTSHCKSVETSDTVKELLTVNLSFQMIYILSPENSLNNDLTQFTKWNKNKKLIRETKRVTLKKVYFCLFYKEVQQKATI